MAGAINHMELYSNEVDPDIRKRSRYAALLAILFWIVVMAIPFFSYQFPPPEKQGILLAFGDPDGGGDAISASQVQSEDTSPSTPTASPVKPLDEPQEASKEKLSSKSVPTSIESVTEDISPVRTSEKSETEQKKSKQKEEAENKRKEEQRKAEQRAAEKKREEEAEQKRKEAQEAKKSFSDLFSGEGEGSQAQNQGDPEGDPDAKKLDGITTGTGVVGGGLKDRGILREPKIDENSQKTGRIVVRVCVNSEGKVIESKYTQKGSTSTDLILIKVAEDAAKQYRFSPSTIEKQCGTISVDFKLQ